MSDLASDAPPTAKERAAAKKELTAKMGKASDLKNPTPAKPAAPSKPAAARGKSAEQKRAPAPVADVEELVVDYLWRLHHVMRDRMETVSYASPDTHKEDLIRAQVVAISKVSDDIRRILKGEILTLMMIPFPRSRDDEKLRAAHAAAQAKDAVNRMPKPDDFTAGRSNIESSIDLEVQAHPLSPQAEQEIIQQRRAANAPPDDDMVF